MFSVIFPGQGSQSVGMGKEFYNKYPCVRELFQEADDKFKFSFSNLLINGPKDKIDNTENTQPAIFLVGYSIFKLLKKEFNIDLNRAEFFAGHSLGEYTALACSNKLSLKDASLILKKRGELMNNAVSPNLSGMAALIGKDSTYVQKIIDDNDIKLEIANDNSPKQVVLSLSLIHI